MCDSFKSNHKFTEETAYDIAIRGEMMAAFLSHDTRLNYCTPITDHITVTPLTNRFVWQPENTPVSPQKQTIESYPEPL
jgi:hypothetical protein